MKSLIILLSMLIPMFCSFCRAQGLTVKSVTLQPTDLTAKVKPVILNNSGDNDTCALIKIKVGDLKGLQFTNPTQYIGDVTYADGVYMLYKSSLQSRLISYQHADYEPGQIDLGEYGYRRLKGGKTYLVVMEAPIKGIGKNIVVLRVFPNTATVTFNSQVSVPSQSGVYEFPVADGTYNFSVRAPDYEPSSGSITVANGETNTQSLRLKPITHEVEVTCNISKAHVFVDNIDYGRVGVLRMPQGNHLLRVQAEGYLDTERTVAINSTTHHIDFQLKKNQNVVNIHATPVTIISDSRNIYKNNKKLEGWKSGTPVKFMPGEYMLSDDRGNTKIINVGTVPMKVTL